MPCAWHHLDDEGLHTYLPVEFQAWASAQGRRVERVGAEDQGPTLRRAKHEGPEVASALPRHTTLAIVSPSDGATYLIDPTLRREFQTLQLRAVGLDVGRLEWRVSGRVVGTSKANDSFEWPLTPGAHRIEATDARGRTAEATITVR